MSPACVSGLNTGGSYRPLIVGMPVSTPKFVTCLSWAVNMVVAEARAFLWRSRTRPTRAIQKEAPNFLPRMMMVDRQAGSVGGAQSEAGNPAFYRRTFYGPDSRSPAKYLRASPRSTRVPFYRRTFYGHRHPIGRRQRIVDPAHFHGVAGVARPVCAAEPAAVALPEPALLRPLAECEQVVGGGWS
jgi:hypothetical protein